MRRIRSIHQLFSGSPLAIDQRGMDRLLAQVMEQVGNSQVKGLLAQTQVQAGDADQANSWRNFMKATGLFPYYVNPDGTVVHTLDEEPDKAIQPGAVAVVPMQGTLVREAWAVEEVFWGLASADRITSFLRKLTLDARVAGAVVTSNCPGGMVSGTEKLSRAWEQLGAKKKTILHVDDLAASAAYWFGCHSNSIQLDGHTAEVGSVGVMMSFFDFIPLYEKMGVVYNELYAEESPRKNEEWRALRTQKDPKLIQQGLGETAQEFHRVVTTQRPQLAANEAALSGAMFQGRKAIDVGMADGFADLDACIAMVRRATPAGAAPPAAQPQQQVPPNNEGTDDDEATTQNTMKFSTRIAALLAGLFATKEEVSQEGIDAANAELEAREITGLKVVTSEEHALLTDHCAKLEEQTKAAQDAEAAKDEAVIARANADDEAKAARNAQAKAEGELATITATLDEALQASSLSVADGSSAAATLATALTDANAKLATALAENERLKGEDAPSKAPAAVTGAGQGDAVVHDEKASAEFLNL